MCLGAWHRFRLRTSVRLRCGREGKLAREAADEWREQQILPPLIVLPKLSLVTLRDLTGGSKSMLLIAGDSTDAQSFRRLRVWLRWRAEDMKRTS